MCDRRSVLQTAAGMGLSVLLPGMDSRAASQRGPERSKSLIVVWLDGGASQLETWDPHPNTRVGGGTRAIPTRVSGLEIGDAFPQLAEKIHYVSVIRSLVSKEGDHERAMQMVRTGYRPDQTVRHPSLGSIVARESPADGLDLPQFISLGFNQFASRGGYLGGRNDAFLVADRREAIRADQISRHPRQKQRLLSLNMAAKSFERGREAALQATLFHELLEAATKMISSDQLKAFDIGQEPQGVREAYGESEVGRSCLAARRLVEVGVRVVEVTHHNYDTHEDNFTSHRRLAKELDPALASLIQDLAMCDLLSSTAVLVIGELGRTPKINAKDGRDHWPNGFSCLVGGAGIRSGRVIGATDPEGEQRMPDQPVEIASLFATLLQALGIDPTKPVITPIGRPIKLADAPPIAELQET